MSVVAALFMDQAAAAAASATWDPANKGTGIVLSNGNMTAANVSSGWTTVLSTTSKSAGKWYYEVHLDNINAGSLYAILGFAQAGGNLNSYIGAGGESSGFFRASGNSPNGAGIVTVSGSLPTSPASTGDVLAIAIDFGAGKAWGAYNNTFAGTPSSGTSPAWTWTPAGSWFMATAFDANSAGQTLQDTLNSPTTYSPPAGFSSWT